MPSGIGRLVSRSPATSARSVRTPGIAKARRGPLVWTASFFSKRHPIRKELFMPIYLNYSDLKIKGDVTEEGHKDWIELSSFGWGLARGISARAGKVTDRESS